ncbi:ECF transporter S component [Sporosarcina thermotolerans]|uniref:ECF transporter S component n=1 Tax=Sporosarcina thermotolerans TaxID=633404 RepID=A0AAW9A6F7_9BACL|nr:ECF transporter S component [Sporosarcina thermotolerans]MDW0116892.1 ECF transporter S component [Sporosarcina thermotolerans]WHT47983.1 ECF transporter S component [Sporosarcina thermotolerans]
MKSKSMWSFKLSTAALVLIPAAVGINYLGKLFADLLKLPLWVDSIGTVLSSMLAGPIVGALSGIVNNVVYGFTTSPVSFVYAITSAVIGLIAGIMAYKGWISNAGKAIVLGLVVGFIAAIVSTPLNIMFWEGTTGNVWGDALFATMLAKDMPLWLASFADSVVVDVPDKVVTVLLSFLIFKGLPKNVKNMYDNTGEIERL